MGLSDLLATMERRPIDTHDTPRNLTGVSPKPAPVLACTLDTPETPHDANARIAVQPPPLEAVTFWRWLIHCTDREAVEVRFSPAATHAEAMTYPGAESAVPIPETSRRVATSAEDRELRSLIARILAKDTAADRAEALAVALGDPDAALVCFRGLAGRSC